MSESRKSIHPSEIERAIADLIAFYEIGRACIDKYPSTMPTGVAAELSAKYRLHHEVIRLARRFASPKHGGYGKRDLDRLFGRSRRYVHPLNRTCVTKLLTVKDATERSELELDMIRERWSKSDLDDVLRLRYGKRMHAGRRPKRAKNSSDAILQILRTAEQAKRSLEQYASVDQGSPNGSTQLPHELKKAIASTSTSLDCLREAAQQIMTKTRRTGSGRR